MNQTIAELAESLWNRLFAAIHSLDASFGAGAGDLIAFAAVLIGLVVAVPFLKLRHDQTLNQELVLRWTAWSSAMFLFGIVLSPWQPFGGFLVMLGGILPGVTAYREVLSASQESTEDKAFFDDQSPAVCPACNHDFGRPGSTDEEE